MGHAGFSIGGLIRVSYGFIHPIFVHSIRLVLLFEFLWNLFFFECYSFIFCCFENGFCFFEMCFSVRFLSRCVGRILLCWVLRVIERMGRAAFLVLWCL